MSEPVPRADGGKSKESMQSMTLAQFWPRYVLAHRRAGTQWLHLTGTVLGLALLGTAIALRNPWLIPAGLVTGYGFAWCGHFLIEGNKPATFGHPFLSFVSNFRMAYCTLTGRMPVEVERARTSLRR